jgi:hypothetical protein
VPFGYRMNVGIELPSFQHATHQKPVRRPSAVDIGGRMRWAEPMRYPEGVGQQLASLIVPTFGLKGHNPTVDILAS